MYEYLEGQVAQLTTGRLVLDVGGVGYDLLVPLSSLFPSTGKLRVWTHHVVREDSQQLYAFADRATRDWFRLLLQVSGVGPKLALGLVSGLGRQEFLAAMASQDLSVLTRVKGVGRRTAEQICLDLREKVALLARDEPGDKAALARGAVPGVARREEAVTALLSIGYSEKEARKAVERAATDLGDADLEQLVRSALAG